MHINQFEAHPLREVEGPIFEPFGLFIVVNCRKARLLTSMYMMPLFRDFLMPSF